MTEGLGDAVPMGRRCAWCSAAAPADATTCSSCGAALAQRDSIGDLRIPGVTDVRPDLLDADGRPLHIPGASLSQGMASGVVVAAMAGGPVGLAALGGMAAVSAAEYMAAGRLGPNGRTSLDELGRPSAVATELADRLDHDAPIAPGENDPWRDEPGRAVPAPEGGSA